MEGCHRFPHKKLKKTLENQRKSKDLIMLINDEELEQLYERGGGDESPTKNGDVSNRVFL